MARAPSPYEFTVDELARDAGLPVRTIREYHTMRLLPAPTKRGRVGIYGPEHAERLKLIARLQVRGYSLAGIRDLLDAWEAGANLTVLLGVESAPAGVDEIPLRLTSKELSERLPSLNASARRRACAVGLLQQQDREFLVRSPALLALVADATATGIPVDDMLNLVDVLSQELTSLSDILADRVLLDLVKPLADEQRLDDLRPVLQRGRYLLLQAVASILADRLGAALLQRSAKIKEGDALREVIDQIRVGAVADSTGKIHRMVES